MGWNYIKLKREDMYQLIASFLLHDVGNLGKESGSPASRDDDLTKSLWEARKTMLEAKKILGEKFPTQATSKVRIG